MSGGAVHVDLVVFLAGLLCAAGVTALVVAVRGLLAREDVIARRLATSEVLVPELGSTLVSSETTAAGVFGRLVSPLGRVAAPMKQEELARVEQQLVVAGVRSEGAVPLYFASKVVLGAALLIGFLWWNASRVRPVDQPLAIAVFAFAVGFYAPNAWLRSRIQDRQTAIERGLPDALDLLVTCVEAGLGLDAAMQRVADEVSRAWPLLGSELHTTVLEIKAGIPRIEAFRRLAHRTGVKDLKSLAATLTQTEIFGTSVALALRIQAEGIRTRRMQRAEERAAYVSVKMTFPLIICILPTVVAVVIGPMIVKMVLELIPAMMGRPS